MSDRTTERNALLGASRESSSPKCRPSPMEVLDQSDTEPPFSTANLLSFISNWWVVSLLMKVHRGEFTAKTDLWACAKLDRSRDKSKRLMELWRADVECRGRDASLARVLWRSERKAFCVLAAWLVLRCFCAFLLPTICTHSLLTLAQQRKLNSTWSGLAVAAIFVGLLFADLVAMGAVNTNIKFLGARLRSTIMGLLYRKLLKLKTNDSEVKARIISAMGTDTERFEQAVQAMKLIMLPPYLILNHTYLGVTIGLITFLPLGILALQVVITASVGRTVSQIRKKTTEIADKRLQIINEILTNIKMVKMYTLEEMFSKRVKDIRLLELKGVRNLVALNSIASTIKTAFNVIIDVVAIMLLLYCKGELAGPEVFTLLGALVPIGIGLVSLPLFVKQLADGTVAVNRVQAILELEEFTALKSMPSPADGEKVALKLSRESLSNSPEYNGTYESAEWKRNDNSNKAVNGNETSTASGGSRNKKITQVDGHCSQRSVEMGRDIEIHKGSLIGICGQIGTGKTRLINAIIGRGAGNIGNISVNGTLAYAPQEVWITSATLRENVVMGSPFDKGRYEQVIEDCCLSNDINTLPNQDYTEIGERGVNLSGGQKQRVSLARALYSKRDIYLLDDPMSALDVKVGRMVFDKCILGLLKKGKTTLLVTHHVQFLSRCDSVLYLSRSEPVIMSSHSELIKTNPSYRDLIVSKQQSINQNPEYLPESLETDRATMATGPNTHVPSEKNSKLETDDIKPAEAIWSTLSTYIRGAEGCSTFGFAVFCVMCLNVFQLLPKWLVTVWITSREHHKNFTESSGGIFKWDEDRMFGAVYLCMPVGALGCAAITTLAMTCMSLKVSQYCHKFLFDKLIRGTMAFFDKTPIGTVQNWFSADQDSVDNFLPTMLEKCLMLTAKVFLSSVLLSFTAPILFLAVIACFTPSILIVFVTSKAVLVFQRLEKMARSPICSLASTSVDGLASITTYDKANRFKTLFFDLVDRHCITSICLEGCCNWAFFCIGLMARIIATCVVIVTVVLPYRPGFGLILIVSLKLLTLLPFLNQHGYKLCGYLTSLERIERNAKIIPEEKANIVQHYQPSKWWPWFGEIIFNEVLLRYDPSLPPVLRHVSFRVKPREKVGIVGRTGAGKSSLIAAMLRLFELEEGFIIVDSLDIAKMGLTDLRARIFLVPQDPALYKGTVRSNLDPYMQKSDNELWQALATCHLTHKVMSLPGGLSHHITGGNSSFSAGEKQLLCLTKAVLQHFQIMLLDEATASVDPQTDVLIQQTLHTVFHGCTILIIAHRLETVRRCDRILVMDEGRVVEFDSPDRLLQQNSEFKKLWEANRSCL